MQVGFGPLTLKADLNFIERSMKLIGEESILSVVKTRPAKLNGHPGVLRLGGGLWYKIVFIPDDSRYLGRCFLDHADKTKALQEFEELCRILK